MVPYLTTTLALLVHNWYPSKVFPGDTFCYFSGMTFAVVAILGHFSKTLLLFFIPQVFNFLYSLPQLFHLVPCPRHRLPKYSKETDTVNTSMAVFRKEEMGTLGRLSLTILSTLKLASVREYTVEVDSDKDTPTMVDMVECNNLTLINFILRLAGPMHEQTLTMTILAIQVLSSVLAFMVRYPLAYLMFGEVVA